MNPGCKLPFAALLLAYAGCTTAPDVHSPAGASAQVSSSRTFALLPVTVHASVPAPAAGEVVHAAETGARDALRTLGYSETSRENADLVFHLHGKAMTPVAVTKWDYLPEPSRFGMSPAKMAATSNSRIFVEAYDNHSRRQVWLGWMECTCHELVPSRIQHEIQRIIATFPPRRGGSIEVSSVSSE